ncbi:GtrA family protein [Qipengyuania sp. 1NDH17]|uniref:GtrA family protein n=1 Tax=Qipengyuania polymorpha TaxID=2867234 RepID=A0ABS7IW04_9SPHN|nr:GtrA family protein [Qipengyuania polymorpha]MBX7457686.1 GtrA family protein [Qipengyuania polymorpha]
MRLVRQLLSFGSVGMLATLAHVAVAYALLTATSINPYAANLAGFLSAVGISFVGNARVTFAYSEAWWPALARFAVVSLTSLGLTTAILAVVEARALPHWTYVLATLAIVPPLTFLLSKFWVFARRT